MQNAIKSTGNLDIIFNTPVTPLTIIREYENKTGAYSAREYALAKARYKAQLKTFAKRNINDTAFEQFQKSVNKYRKAAKLPAHPFDDYTSFKDIMIKTNQNVWLDKNLFKKEKTILKSKKENDIRMAYVQYWTHKMTYQHNKNILQRAKDLYDKHKSSDKNFVIKWSDIYGLQQVETDGITEIKMAPVDLSAFDKMIELTPNMILRADESIYTDVRILKPQMQKIFSDYDNRTLKYYKNLNTLFLANIVHAMIKSKWSQSTLDMIMQYLRDGGSTTDITDIVELMIDDGDFDQTWHYEEKISENGVNLEEARFLQLFNDMLASELPDDDDEPTEEQKQDDSKLGYEPGLKYIKS